MPERPPRSPAVLGWVKGIFARPAKPASAPAAAEPAAPDATKQRAELFARLVVHDPATQFVHHLFIVHSELRRAGWAAVEALTSKVLGRALFEAEVMASQEPSPLFATVVEKVRELHGAALAREQRAAIDAEHDWDTPPMPDVADSDFTEFERTERSWAGTVPAAL